MAQIIKTQKLPQTKEVIFTSDSEQIVFVKFINPTRNDQYLDAEWSGGKLMDNTFMMSSQHPIEFAHSQHELTMKPGDTISAMGGEGMEYIIIA